MHNYICNKCSKEFETRKKGQTYCSKSCANGINATKTKINEKSIFSKGICSISAYILAIILSDGCLSYDAHSHRYRITVTMNDYSIIKYLRDNYSPDKKIYEYKHKIGRAVSYTFITTNEFDINYLRNLGVVERKSNIIKFPIIKDTYKRHIIRGIFDGDGSIYINKTKTNHNGIVKRYEYINASFTSGSYEFAKSILDILTKADIHCSLVKDSRRDNNCWYVKIYSREAIKRLYKYMYNYSSIYLDRKRDLFKVMI
ncbi:LAGLIDADG family homing endonuclease [Clostridium gasigenes]|uniref:LAGLIDADG family homing endonuclease n=1 Tax=Clostridium gasigenes TaxID=94869 RepID=UPI001C0AFE65|nr:LAGLIDADG family homing endonuclease [Clostridium gasigenes]MBU3136980.1 LAGLIDADG family homing endonuclease [Clostridium gasigenes]